MEQTEQDLQKIIEKNKADLNDLELKVEQLTIELANSKRRLLTTMTELATYQTILETVLDKLKDQGS